MYFLGGECENVDVAIVRGLGHGLGVGVGVEVGLKGSRLSTWRDKIKDNFIAAL